MLVDAAIAVMSREGVAHTTTRAIVAEAGMQIGVFHYCFRSKEELVLEVIRTIGQRSFAAVAEVRTRSTDPAELIHLATRAYWEHIAANPLEHLLTFELTQYALRQPGHEDAATEQYASYYASTERLLTALCEVGDCTWRTPVDRLARFTLATVEGITMQWLVSRDDAMARALLDQLAQHLCDDAGLVVPPPQ
jgi:AcrR family transcriptional regulator